jgi:flavin-dependent dehydrogenase
LGNEDKYTDESIWDIMADKYDVVIVGGGPGGSLAAKTAAEKGLTTVFIERARTPGEKASSGCGLSPRVWRDFSFIKEMPMPNLKIKFQTLHLLDEKLNERFMIRWSPSDLGKCAEGREFFQTNVYRSELDPWLAKLATDAGAELKTSTLVTDLLQDEKGQVTGVVTDKGEKIEGAVTIGADGAFSLVAKRAGLREKWKSNEITLVVDCDFEASQQKLDEVIGPDEFSNNVFVSPLYPATYIATMPGGFHVGFGQWLGKFAAGTAKRPYEYLKEVIRSRPLQQFITKVGAKPREFHAHLLPWMPRMPTNTFGDGVLLVGDAAGFPCPLEAEGVYYAMLSGKMAAESAAQAISGGDISATGLKIYEDTWRKSTIGEEFSAAKEWAELWAGIFFDPPNWEPLVRVANNIMFWASWSDPHIDCFRRELGLFGQEMPTLMSFVKSYLMPLIKKAKVPMFRTALKLGWQYLKAKKKNPWV